MKRSWGSNWRLHGGLVVRNWVIADVALIINFILVCNEIFFKIWFPVMLKNWSNHPAKTVSTNVLLA